MPFKSLKQERWGNSPAGLAALGGKKKVAEWNEASKGKKLPETVKKQTPLREADFRAREGRK
jgi:hypothetical protein